MRPSRAAAASNWATMRLEFIKRSAHSLTILLGERGLAIDNACDQGDRNGESTRDISTRDIKPPG